MQHPWPANTFAGKMCCLFGSRQQTYTGEYAGPSRAEARTCRTNITKEPPGLPRQRIWQVSRPIPPAGPDPHCDRIVAHSGM